MAKNTLIHLTPDVRLRTDALQTSLQLKYSGSTAYSYLCALRAMLRVGVDLSHSSHVSGFYTALCAEHPAKGRRLLYALRHLRLVYGLMVEPEWAFLNAGKPGRPKVQNADVTGADVPLLQDFEGHLAAQGLKAASVMRICYYASRANKLIDGRNIDIREATHGLSYSYRAQLISAWGRFARWVSDAGRASEVESMARLPSAATLQLVHLLGRSLREAPRSARPGVPARPGRYARLASLTWADLSPMWDEHTHVVQGMRVPESGRASDWGPDGNLTRAIELYGVRAMDLLSLHQEWACPMHEHDPLFPALPGSGEPLDVRELKTAYKALVELRKVRKSPSAPTGRAKVTEDRPTFPDAAPVDGDYDEDPSFGDDQEAITAFRNAALSGAMSRISAKMEAADDAADAAERERLIGETY
jgi:hypothetical protein